MKKYVVTSAQEEGTWNVLRFVGNTGVIVASFAKDSNIDPKKCAEMEASRRNAALQDTQYNKNCKIIQEAINKAKDLEHWLFNLQYRMENDDAYEGQLVRMVDNTRNCIKPLMDALDKIPSGPDLTLVRDNHLKLEKEQLK